MGTKLKGAAASDPDDLVRKSELDAAIAGVTAGSASWTDVEIDFGSTPVWEVTVTVTDAAVSPTSSIAVLPSGKVATGRVGNDAAWDSIQLAALPGSGSFELTATATPGPVVGRRIVQYQIG